MIVAFNVSNTAEIAAIPEAYANAYCPPSSFANFSSRSWRFDCRFWHNQILHCHQAPFDEMLKSHKVVGLLNRNLHLCVHQNNFGFF